MTALNSPHDRFFKTVFGRTEVAAEFLERYLPAEVAATVDWATLRPEKETFLDPQLTQHPADLLYAVTLHGGETGGLCIRAVRAQELRRGADQPGLVALPGADLGAVAERWEHGLVAGDHPRGVLPRRGAVGGETAVCGDGGGRAGLATLRAKLRVSS
jgi:hypothetical protein